MGLGSDLMRFFASGTGNKDVPFVDFHEAHSETHREPAVTLRAATRLCDAGRLFRGEIATGPPVFSARFFCLKTVAELQADFEYGTFDFIVGGFPEVRRRFAQSVFQLEVETADADLGHGTAFALRPTVLLTAKHCVADMSRVSVQGEGDEFPIEPVTVISDPSGLDVAALVMPRPLRVPTFNVRAAQPLDSVMTMGFPGLGGAYPSLMSSTGEIAGAATAYIDGQNYWITTCEMTGGSSGAPVVGADGLVVGVVSSRPVSDDSTDPHGFNFVVPCDEAVRRLVERVLPD